MTSLSRMFAPALLAAGLGFGAMVPAPVQAQDNLARVLVDIADVVFRSGDPYYRHGNYGYNDRLVMGRDRYGRRVYYRVVPRYDNYNRYNRYNSPWPLDYGPWTKTQRCKRSFLPNNSSTVSRYISSGTQQSTGQTEAHCGSS